MADYREVLMTNFSNALCKCNYSSDEIRVIYNLLIIELDKFELTERCTDLTLIDTSSMELLKLYAGCLLTEGKSKRTVNEYIKLLRRFMNEVGKPLIDVKLNDIRVWLAREQQKATLCTCENYRSYLSAFYRWLSSEEYIDKNPMLKVKPIKFNQGIKSIFSDVEIDALRGSCKDVRERAIVEFLLSSGCRVSEMCSMDITDIDFKRLEVKVREAKGNKSRITYITPVCAVYMQKYLDTRKDDNDCLLVGKNDSRLSINMVEKDMAKLGERARVNNVYPHRFRRTFATNSVKKGMDIRTVQQLLGHTNIGTTMRYVNLDNDHIRNEYRRYN